MKDQKTKAVLLSVKNVYAELLVSGAKTIELRRRFPVNLPKNTKLLIYSSGAGKKIIGQCEIAKVEQLPLHDLWKLSSVNAMISWDDFQRYFSSLEQGFAIHVKKPLKYKNPMLLSDLVLDKKIVRPPQSYCYI